MTDRIDALRVLLKRVEAGTATTMRFDDALGGVFCDRFGCGADVAEVAYFGSLDAALGLVAAVLPGWRVETLYMGWAGTWFAALEREADMALCAAAAATPARALLIATLKALIAQEEGR